MTTNNPLTWPPYKIVAIEIGEDRTGFIGRAAAMRINGIETIVLCRNTDELATLGNHLMAGAFDSERIYKATVIRTEGVEVDLPPPLPEVDTPPVTTEVPVKPAIVETPPLVREDGVPVVQYLGETDEEADARIAKETEAFEKAQGDTTDEDGNPVVHGEANAAEDDEL